jgi:hypothetical protein
MTTRPDWVTVSFVEELLREAAALGYWQTEQADAATFRRRRDAWVATLADCRAADVRAVFDHHVHNPATKGSKLLATTIAGKALERRRARAVLEHSTGPDCAACGPGGLCAEHKAIGRGALDAIKAEHANDPRWRR